MNFCFSSLFCLFYTSFIIANLWISLYTLEISSPVYHCIMVTWSFFTTMYKIHTMDQVLWKKKKRLHQKCMNMENERRFLFMLILFCWWCYCLFVPIHFLCVIIENEKKKTTVEIVITVWRFPPLFRLNF